ncbi:MAG: hypothetical protein D6675_00990 [Gemmatimonadetes bacterium]|nr:MAG: hypothetical protein D6675_00990 [Gemmatimonadota bacterium]
MEDILYGVKISAIGISIVFGALIVIAWILSLFDRVDTLLTRSKSPQTGDASVVSDSVHGVSPEVVAAISAAVLAAYGKARIRKIRYRSGPAEASSWSIQGRATVMASHRIEKQP